jgi:glycosyltransferase involved in cell wall biosynthesis
MSKTKLLYVVTEDWFFVAHRLHLATAARDAGFDVSVATRVAGHGAAIRDAGFGLHEIAFRRSTIDPIVAASEVQSLRRLYTAERPDIVHHIALKPVVLGSLAARGLKIRGIVNGIVGLGSAFANQSLRAKALRVPLQIALRTALNTPRSRATVENRDDFDDLVRLGLARRDAITLVRGSGVNVPTFDVSAPPPGPPLVVLPSRLLRLKGVGEFVEAARILKARGIDARFALVGQPDAQNATSVTSAELDAWKKEGAVEIWGYRSDMPRVLEAASIICLPTYYREGLPMSLIEAAAARRAIVTTDVAGAREIVRGGKAGWLVPPRDAAALANALADAITHPEKREAFATLAHADAVNFYDARKIAEQTIGIYRSLLQA